MVNGSYEDTAVPTATNGCLVAVGRRLLGLHQPHKGPTFCINVGEMNSHTTMEIGSASDEHADDLEKDHDANERQDGQNHRFASNGRQTMDAR